jgi:tetratricopeptide (TPR) repeat protein
MDSNQILQHECVSLTGRGLSFNRIAGIELIHQHGGRYQREVNSQTTLLVVGAAGWPLQKNGRLTRNLDFATRLSRQRYLIKIETEEEFLTRISSNIDSSLYTLPQLARILKVSPQRLLAWKNLGLIPPQTYGGIDYFDFQSVVRCRTLATLATTRSAARRLRRSLKTLQRFLGTHDSFLDNLVDCGNHLATRDDHGRLFQVNGQQVFDFESDIDQHHPTLLAHSHRLGMEDEQFEQAVALEAEGEYTAAQQLYMKILERDPTDSDVLFNLGNVLTSQGLYAESVTAYREAVVFDRDFAEAWNNLGNSLLELQRYDEAKFAFQNAMRIDANFSAAVYGLAITSEHLGDLARARRYWALFLRMESDGEFAKYARERLKQTSIP